MNPVSLYITASNREEAISISRELLSLRLIACANIIDGATSLYHWQGAVEHKAESLIIGKSVSGHMDAIIAIVKTLSSYECPCVVGMPIAYGNEEFIKWLQEQVAEVS